MSTVLAVFRLSMKRAKASFWLPIFLVYVLLPGLVVTSSKSLEPERCCEILSFAVNSLLPICAVLWGMAYLQIWIDNDAVETIHACDRGRRTCAGAMAFLGALLWLMALPGSIAAYHALGYPLAQWGKLRAEIFFSLATLHFVSILTRSVGAGVIAIISYLLFCALFSNDNSVSKFCIIDVKIGQIQEILPRYLVVFGASLALWFMTHLTERHFYRKY